MITTAEMQIPNDVMEAARETFRIVANTYGNEDEMAEPIARAILAERTRCASIVENIYLMSDYGDEAKKKSRLEIASIIRNC